MRIWLPPPVPVWRHLEAAELEQTEPAPERIGAVELVDAELGPVGVAGDVGEQVAERAVDHPGPVLGVIVILVGEAGDLGKGDLELVQVFWPALVHPRRLAGRADEPPGEQVGQRRVVLPEGQHADQQVRAPEQW